MKVSKWFSIVVIVGLASVASAQQVSNESEAEQKMLHQAAKEVAEQNGFDEAEMYWALAWMNAARKAEVAAKDASNRTVAKHERLRGGVYILGVDVLIQTAVVKKAVKELIADLQAEQQMTGGTVVSPELSRRINVVGVSAQGAMVAVDKMSSAMIELASFEAVQGCSDGGGILCSEGLSKAVAEIQAAMVTLKKTIQPFFDAAKLNVGKTFTY